MHHCKAVGGILGRASNTCLLNCGAGIMWFQFMGVVMSDHAVLQDDTCSEPGAGIPGDLNIPSNYVSSPPTEDIAHHTF